MLGRFALPHSEVVVSQLVKKKLVCVAKLLERHL